MEQNLNNVKFDLFADGTYQASIIFNDDEYCLPSTYNGKKITQIFQYKLLENDTYAIEIIQSKENLVIPSVFNGKKVSCIFSNRDEGVINGKKIISVEIPETISMIDMEALFEFTSVKSIKIPKNVTYIGEFSFGSWKSLIDLVIPESVKTIDTGAFSRCISLKNVKLPESLENIGIQAFSYCENLKTIRIPNSVKFIGRDAFFACDMLENIIVDDDNTEYKSIDGNLYSKDGKTFIKYAEGKKASEFVIPKTVTKIEEEAFDNTECLKRIILPKGLNESWDERFVFDD